VLVAQPRQQGWRATPCRLRPHTRASARGRGWPLARGSIRGRRAEGWAGSAAWHLHPAAPHASAWGRKAHHPGCSRLLADEPKADGDVRTVGCCVGAQCVNRSRIPGHIMSGGAASVRLVAVAFQCTIDGSGCSAATNVRDTHEPPSASLLAAVLLKARHTGRF
jgi:hypothetical protein